MKIPELPENAQKRLQGKMSGTPGKSFAEIFPSKGERKNGSKVFYVLKDGKITPSIVAGRYAGWKRGKIFGRLDCRSGRRMKKKNRVFFLSWQDAIDAGYRPCENCKPTPDDVYK